MNYAESRIYAGQPEYSKHFWNAMRGEENSYLKLAKARSVELGTYNLPSPSFSKYLGELEKESLFRNIGTVITAYGPGYRILAKECNDLALWVAENDTIPIYEGMTDFTAITVESHKLAAFLKLDEDFVHNASFDFERYLIKRLANNFGRAEDNAFISGTSIDMPTGILSNTYGAEVGVTTPAVSYDDVIKLFFSLKSEYRKKAVWLMNDETALILRTLKDTAGKYLWCDSDDTILGKKVIISEYMPNIEIGSRPIAFGDFSYYWIIERKPISIRTLIEKFADYNQIGYLAFEFLDGKLIRREAVKVLQITAE